MTLLKNCQLDLGRSCSVASPCLDADPGGEPGVKNFQLRIGGGLLDAGGRVLDGGIGLQNEENSGACAAQGDSEDAVRTDKRQEHGQQRADLFAIWLMDD